VDFEKCDKCGFTMPSYRIVGHHCIDCFVTHEAPKIIEDYVHEKKNGLVVE
jgi:hypothetical protein